MIYTYRYFHIPDEEAAKYYWIIFYLRLQIVISMLILAIMGLLLLGVIMLCCLKVYEARNPEGLERSTLLRTINLRLINALGAMQGAETINFIIANIQKTKFNKEIHRSIQECPICLLEFVEGVEIIELPCDQRHYFHAPCIQAWISGQGMISCPLCKKNIADELSHKMEEKKESVEILPEVKKDEDIEIKIDPSY